MRVTAFNGSPGAMRVFMERLMFPNLAYTDPPQSLFPKRINTRFCLYDECTPERLKEVGYDQHITQNERVLKMLFGASESLLSFDTYQFEDYSKMVADRFDHDRKVKSHKEIFPDDCNKAFAMGARFARQGV